MAQQPRKKGRPKAFYAKPEQSTIQSLDRAIDVLDLLAAHAGLTLTEIANELAQSPATMHRVLSTLEARDMVEMDGQSQTWHIGAAAYRIGSAFLHRSGVVERSRPAMRRLMEQTGETSNLGIEMNGNVMFIGQVETNETIRAFFPPGTISPMHASGIGKALLSRYSDDRFDRVVSGRDLEGFTDKTVTDPERLRDDLRQARDRGWAFRRRGEGHRDALRGSTHPQHLWRGDCRDLGLGANQPDAAGPDRRDRRPGRRRRARGVTRSWRPAGRQRLIAVGPKAPGA